MKDRAIPGRDADGAPVLWDDVPEGPEPGGKSAKPAVTPDALMRMASYYLARYSASTARLREVLERKIRRRCELRDASVPEPVEVRAMIDAVVERLTRAGLLDDAAYGRGRAAALARKGWPAWRIRAELQHQDIDAAGEGLAEAVDLDADVQAARLAQRKRLGPYRPGAREPYRDRDIRALARAGFPVSVAKRVVDGEAE